MFAKHLACVSQCSSRMSSSGTTALVYLAKATLFLAVCLCPNASSQDDIDARLIRRWQAYTRSVKAIEFSPDSRTLASNVYQGGVTLWRVDSGASRQLSEQGGSSIVYSPDGKQILFTVGEPNKAILMDVETREIRQEFRHTWVVSSVCFSPDGRYVITGGGEAVAGEEDGVGTMRFWDGGSGTLLQLADVGGLYVTDMQFSSSGEYLFAMNAYRNNRFLTFVEGSTWSAATWEPVFRFRREERYFGQWPIFDLSPAEPCYAVAPSTTQFGWGIDILDILNGRIVKDSHRPEYEGRQLSPEYLNYFPSGTLMAMAAREDVWLYDLESREVVCLFPFVGENPDDESVRSLAVSPDGRCLAIGKTNGYSELWDVSAFSGAGVGEEWNAYE